MRTQFDSCDRCQEHPDFYLHIKIYIYVAVASAPCVDHIGEYTIQYITRLIEPSTVLLKDHTTPKYDGRGRWYYKRRGISLVRESAKCDVA